MVSELDDESEAGKRVIELGPGTGAVTSRLWQRYPETGLFLRNSGVSENYRVRTLFWGPYNRDPIK